ncbi:hypothetical protein [Nocardioides sp. GXZ039]|uniref:hypothetical protein n=1 Tax=Nocardioides sp. GXZ039 TaxID=3136018 RepID=UPI0030F38562
MTASRRSWRRRALLIAAAAVVVPVGCALMKFDPDPVPVVLVTLLVGIGGFVVLDAVRQVPAVWTPLPPAVSGAEGADARTQNYLRHLENHLSARTPDRGLRDRIRRLADGTLQARHGVRLDSEAGRALIGEQWCAATEGPVERMRPREIDRLIRTIEEL